jgi:hypothetical protein
VQRERKVGGEAKQAVCEEGGGGLGLSWMMGIMGPHSKGSLRFLNRRQVLRRQLHAHSATQ